jgi:hypothetical protein
MTVIFDQATPSNRRRFRLAVIVVLGLICVLLQVGMMDDQVNLYDEGLTLYGAAQVAHGGIPYRDFWSLYGPAAFTVLGGVFRVAGESVLIERAFDVGYRLVIVIAIFLLARRLASTALASAAALCTLFFLIAAQSYGAPLFPSVACALLAVIAADSAARSRRPVLIWFSAGIAAGMAMAYRIDIGVCALLSAGLGVAYSRWAGESALGFRRSLGALAAGCSIVVVPIAIALGCIVPWTDLSRDLFIIPLTVYAPNRHLPFPTTEPIREMLKYHGISPLSEYVVYLPLVVLAIGLVYSRLNRTSRDVNLRSGAAVADRRLLWMVIALDLLFVAKGSIRVQILHMSPALATSSVLVAAMAARYPPSRAKMLATLLAITLAAKVAFDNEARLRLFDRLAALASDQTTGRTRAICDVTSIERMRCFHVAPAMRDVIDYVRAHTTAADTIYVGSTRHDVIFENDAALYFLTGRRSATKWHDLHPGVQNTLEIQEEMIADFGTNLPTLLILNQHWTQMHEPNRSSTSSGVTLLDDWIRAHYTLAYTVGTFFVLQRRGVES